MFQHVQLAQHSFIHSFIQTTCISSLATKIISACLVTWSLLHNTSWWLVGYLVARDNTRQRNIWFRSFLADRIATQYDRLLA